MGFKAASMSMAAILILTVTGIAVGSGPHFKSASGSVDSDFDLVVSFDEVGVGNTTINYSVTATKAATYCSTTGSGSATVSAGASKNNVSVPSFDTEIAADLSANVSLKSVTFSSITITDTTNNVSTTVPNVTRSTGNC